MFVNDFLCVLAYYLLSLFTVSMCNFSSIFVRQQFIYRWPLLRHFSHRVNYDLVTRLFAKIAYHTTAHFYGLSLSFLFCVAIFEAPFHLRRFCCGNLIFF